MRFGLAYRKTEERTHHAAFIIGRQLGEGLIYN
jgi:hypothetical protein